MSEKYKIYPEGLFFITLTVVGWIDVFTREEYAEEIIDNLNFCIEQKGLKVYCFCIMSSHVHLIVSSVNVSLSEILRDFKSYTAKKIIASIEESPRESRKEWLLHLFEFYAKGNSHNSKYQFWQQHNHPIDLVSPKFVDEKRQYIHENPVKAKLVNEASNYIYSSANSFTRVKLEAL